MTDETPTTESQENQTPLSLLARNHFGNQYKGDVSEPERKEESQEAASEEESAEVEEPEQAESEEVEESPETQGDEETEASSEEESDEGESEEVPISSWQELVEHQGWDPEWAQSLKVPVKVNGEQSDVPFQELVASYQKQEAADKYLEDAKAKREQLNQELSEYKDSLNERLTVAAKLIENQEKRLEKEVANIDWDALRQDDPAEFSAKKQEIADKRQEIEREKREAADQYKQSVEHFNQQSKQQLQEYIQKEKESLLQKVPEFSDPEKSEHEQKALATYLQKEGFSSEELAQAYDHRLIVLARKARLYDEGQKKVDTAKKRVAKVPKVLKPGASKPQAQVNKEKERKLQSRLRKTGSVDDAFALLRARKQR